MTLMNQNKLFTGACLCGEVGFEFHLEKIKMIYHCFCSLCRKQSGAGVNAATFVQASSFHWRRGQQLIQTFSKKTGFTNCFCRQCGSPVPNALAHNPNIVWIPLGLIQEDFVPEQVLNFCMKSKASWTTSDVSLVLFDELPNRMELQHYFELNQ